MRSPALLKGFGAVLLAGLVSACGSMNVRNLLPGSASSQSAPATVTAQAVPNDEDDEIECPAVEIRPGATAHRFGAGETPRAQASISNVARECRLEGDRIRITVGVEGHVKLGAGGSPGSWPVPVRVVMKRGETVVAARTERVNVVIPANDVLAGFVSVQKDFLVPRTGAELSIGVGLDTGSDVVAPAAAKRR